MGWIAEVINLDENLIDPNDAHIANAQPQPNLEKKDHPEANIQMVQRRQNADHFLNSVQNTIGGHWFKCWAQPNCKTKAYKTVV